MKLPPLGDGVAPVILRDYPSIDIRIMTYVWACFMSFVLGPHTLYDKYFQREDTDYLTGSVFERHVKKCMKEGWFNHPFYESTHEG